MLALCKRELVQAIWFLLLDKDFFHAWEHGIDIEFVDGITRRGFPWIVVYSCDYVEK